MSIKSNMMTFVFSFILLFSITFNSIEKTVLDYGHEQHNQHDSIVHIHKHSHNGITHTHSHQASNISVLDYFSFDSNKIDIDTLQRNFAIFDISNLKTYPIKQKLLKPPKFS